MSGPDDRSEGGKAEGAMLAIGELAVRIGVPAHVLRYWETRFPDLRPLQRSGRRRYYRAEDVALATRIHHLLHVQGFTVDGARKALSESGDAAPIETRAPARRETSGDADAVPAASGIPVESLIALRRRLVAALG